MIFNLDVYRETLTAYTLTPYSELITADVGGVGTVATIILSSGFIIAIVEAGSEDLIIVCDADKIPLHAYTMTEAKRLEKLWQETVGHNHTAVLRVTKPIYVKKG